MSKLTQREREVVNLLAQGRKQTEIARELCIGYSTVVRHVQHIRDKTNTKSALEIAVKAAGMERI